jgi:hypothetical protein
VAVSACLVALSGAISLCAAHNDSEQNLLPKIEHEQDPIKKAKLEIRLAQLELAHANAACQKDDHESCHAALNGYLDAIRSAWKALQASGKNAVKSPSGFRDLDIALREDEHALEDLKRRVPIEDRVELDPVVKEVQKVHAEVFSALFPSGAGRSKDKKYAPPEGSEKPK